MPRRDDPPNPAITRFIFDQWVHRVASVHNTAELDRRLNQEGARIFIPLSRLSDAQPLWIVSNAQDRTFRATDGMNGHKNPIKDGITNGMPFIKITRDGKEISLTVQANPNATGIRYGLSPIFTLQPEQDTIEEVVDSSQAAVDIPVSLDTMCTLQFGDSQTRLTIVLFSPQTLITFGAQNITEPLVFIASSQMQPEAQIA